jgi:hypothetical protein
MYFSCWGLKKEHVTRQFVDDLIIRSYYVFPTRVFYLFVCILFKLFLLSSPLFSPSSSCVVGLWCTYCCVNSSCVHTTTHHSTTPPHPHTPHHATPHPTTPHHPQMFHTGSLSTDQVAVSIKCIFL